MCDYSVVEVIEAMGFDPSHQSDITEVVASAVVNGQGEEIRVEIPDKIFYPWGLWDVSEHILLGDFPNLMKWFED